MIAGAFGALLLAGCSRPAQPTGIVLITIDTCRADHLGCYEASVPATPNIDALALDGTVFLQASATAPLTLPSHASILTGLAPDRHGLRDNGEGRLSPEAVTVAELLRSQGWSTAAFISAYPLLAEFGCDQGFETYDDRLNSNASGLNNPGKSGPSDATTDAASRIYYDERVAGDVTRAAAEWLANHISKDAPFFLWVHYFDPHASYRAPEPYALKFGANSYPAEIAYVDAEIGNLLTALGSRRSKTCVIVTADHGESLGEHKEMTHGLFLYESVLRVPLVMQGPGVPRNRKENAPTSLVSVMPTVLDLADIALPEDLDGGSLLTGGSGSKEDAFLYAETLFPRLHFGWAGLRSIRKGPWKFIDAPLPELYHLETDPQELHNRFDAEPDVVAELRSVLRQREEDRTPFASAALPDEETRSRLAALGYVGGSGETTSSSVMDLWNVNGRDPKDMVETFNRLQQASSAIVDRRDEDAEKLLMQLLGAEPENRDALEQLSLLRRLQEDWSEAASICKRLLALRPEDHKVRQNLAFALLQQGDRKAARDQYQEILRRDPSFSDAWLRLANLAAEDGQPAEAATFLREATKLTPRDASVFARLGQVLEASGDSAAALGAYNQALAADSSEAVSLLQLSLVRSRSGDLGGAVALLKRGIERRPEDVDLLNNLAWLLVDRSLDPNLAFEHARRAVTLAPEDPAVLDTFGWAAYRSGKAGQGLAALRKAYDVTRDETVAAHLGLSLLAVGERAAGMDFLREATGRNSKLLDIPEVREAMKVGAANTP